MRKWICKIRNGVTKNDLNTIPICKFSISSFRWKKAAVSIEEDSQVQNQARNKKKAISYIYKGIQWITYCIQYAVLFIEYSTIFFNILMSISICKQTNWKLYKIWIRLPITDKFPKINLLLSTLYCIEHCNELKKLIVPHVVPIQIHTHTHHSGTNRFSKNMLAFPILIGIKYGIE